MLTGTSHHPDEVVGKLAAGAFAPWSFTVRHVAINAVMAGAKPEHLPVILAIALSGYVSLISSTKRSRVWRVDQRPDPRQARYE